MARRNNWKLMPGSRPPRPDHPETNFSRLMPGRSCFGAPPFVNLVEGVTGHILSDFGGHRICAVWAWLSHCPGADAARGAAQMTTQTLEHELLLAPGMSRLGNETAFEVLSKAKALERQGKSIIHLEIGEPDFDTPSNIVDTAAAALRAPGGPTTAPRPACRTCARPSPTT
jgi:hypothetical protein